MNNPIVSIVMSTYNEEIEWLKMAIESILNQTFNNLEFIIVLDNPNRSDIEQLIKQYKEDDDRVVIIKNEENFGLVKSLNRALKIARGKYIARMDADDVAHLDRLQAQYDFMEENNKIDFTGAKVDYIDEKGSIIKEYKNLISTDHDTIIKLLRYGNAFNHPTWFFKKDILKDIVEYNEIPFAEDYDFVTRVVTSNYRVANIDRILLDYRVRNNGISVSNNFKQVKSASCVREMYKKRLSGKSDVKILTNLTEYVNSTFGRERFEKALEYKRLYKQSKGIVKVYYWTAGALISMIHLKLYVNTKLYVKNLSNKSI